MATSSVETAFLNMLLKEIEERWEEEKDEQLLETKGMGYLKRMH